MFHVLVSFISYLWSMMGIYKLLMYPRTKRYTLPCFKWYWKDARTRRTSKVCLVLSLWHVIRRWRWREGQRTVIQETSGSIFAGNFSSNWPKISPVFIPIGISTPVDVSSHLSERHKMERIRGDVLLFENGRATDRSFTTKLAGNIKLLEAISATASGRTCVVF